MRAILTVPGWEQHVLCSFLSQKIYLYMHGKHPSNVCLAWNAWAFAISCLGRKKYKCCAIHLMAAGSQCCILAAKNIDLLRMCNQEATLLCSFGHYTYSHTFSELSPFPPSIQKNMERQGTKDFISRILDDVVASVCNRPADEPVLCRVEVRGNISVIFCWVIDVEYFIPNIMPRTISSSFFPFLKKIVMGARRGFHQRMKQKEMKMLLDTLSLLWQCSQMKRKDILDWVREFGWCWHCQCEIWSCCGKIFASSTQSHTLTLYLTSFTVKKNC